MKENTEEICMMEITCPRCQGTGIEPFDDDDDIAQCDICGGLGEIEVPDNEINPLL